MSEKSEALRLADELLVASLGIRHCLEALSAVELRRLHADNERLREELRQSGIDHTRAEVERLTADNERLTATAFQAQNAAIDLAQRYKRLRGLLLDIRNDAQTSHWHRDINEALQEPPR